MTFFNTDIGLRKDQDHIAILSIGTALPSYRIKQTDVVDMIVEMEHLSLKDKRTLKILYKSTGIEYRHSVLGNTCQSLEANQFFANTHQDPYPSTQDRMTIYRNNALPLAITAIEDALSSIHNFELSEITHLITVSCTGMYAPGLDIEITQQLGLSTSVHRTAINFMGCYGAISGLKMAAAICKGNSTAVVLVVSVEICSIHLQKQQSRDQRVASALFSDGAAAAIVKRNPRQQQKYLALDYFYCDMIPDTHQDMTWGIGNQGFDISLSSYVPQLIESGIAQFFQRLLQKSCLSLSDIDYFAIHPGSQKILQSCEKALSLSRKDNYFSYEILRQYGNMSSATMLFILKRFLETLANTDTINATKRIFGCAFGPGLTIESLLLSCHYV